MFFLVSVTPSLPIPSSETVVAAASEETVIDNTQSELVGAMDAFDLQSQLLQDRLPVSPGWHRGEPCRVAAHARSWWNLRRLLLAPEWCH